MKMTDLLGGVLGNSGGLLEFLQGDQTRQAGLADLLSNLGAEQTKPDGNILDQIGGLIKGNQPDDKPDDFLDLLNQVNGPTGGMEQTTGLGAAATLALNMLMGRDASGFANKAVKMGGVAALGSIAMKAFQSWQQAQGSQAQGIAAISPAVHELPEDTAEARAEALLCAMVAAAKADEHIDAQEEARLTRAFTQSGMDTSAQQFFVRELRQPLNAARIAAMADDLETGAEIYAVTLLVVDDMNAAERAYLGDLKDKLGLPSELAATIEADLKA
ncbi:MAG: tellurite resistance TerB family protein [Pseudomonadota bacterium]